jgi:hypothetical protein
MHDPLDLYERHRPSPAGADDVAGRDPRRFAYAMARRLRRQRRRPPMPSSTRADRHATSSSTSIRAPRSGHRLRTRLADAIELADAEPADIIFVGNFSVG